MTVFAASTRHLLPVLLAALACLLLVAEGASGGPRAKRDRPARDTQAPTAPSNLRVTAATASSIAIAWNSSTDNVAVRGYSVYVNGDRSNTSSTSFVIWRLTCGESVAVEVSAYDKAQNRSARTSATVSAAPCPDTSPPSAPAGFRQSATSETAVVVAWNPSTDDTSVVGYGVYRNGLPVAASQEASVTLTDLACGWTYEYAIDAVDGAGNRSARSPVWVTTSQCPTPAPADTQPPSAPAISVGTRTATSLVLQWQASTDNVGVLRYDVFRGTSDVSTSSQEKVGETTGLSFTFGGLDCGTDYSLAVQAVDAAGNKSVIGDAFRFPVRTLDCAPLPPPPDTSPPSTPANFSVAAATASSIALTWSPSTDNVGVTAYGVYRNGTSLPSVSQPGATVTGLQCGTAYILEVDAVDAANNRSSRAAITASTAACPDTQAPTAPTNVVASSRTTTSIALTWSPSTDAVGVTGYGLYRGGTLVDTATGTTGIFSGLSCGTAYTLSVDAHDAAGNRSAKTTVMVSTTACPPPPAPTVTMGESSVMSMNDSGNGNLLVSQKATLAQNGVLRRMSFYVTTASGNLRMAVYAANGSNGGPGTKLAETANFTPTTGWNTVDVLAPVTLGAGTYWLAYLPSSSTLAFRVGSGGEARWTSYSYGPAPATFPASTFADTVRWSFYATLDVTNEAPPPPPPPAAQCADGADNDGDSLVDLADLGCSSSTDDDETNALPPPPPPPSSGTPTLQQIDGGLGYYGQFSNPLPTTPDFFPIGVWGAYSMESSNVAKDKAVGLNTYVWFADTTTPGYIENARAAGMHLIVNRSEGGTRVGSETFGRLLGDEVDMTQGPSACPNAINSVKSSLPNDGRARYANYGKGVLIWSAVRWGSWTDAAAACFVNAQDITSTDLYWHTDPNETSHSQSYTSWGYGWSIERQRMLDATDGVRKPQWGFVEVTNAMNGPSAITPAEIRGAVWHTLIAGARGIIYFQHDFGGECMTHHALRETGTACYGAVIDMVTSVNAQIRSLAPVLNSPFVTSGHSASSSVEHMVKWDGSNFYVFAAARSGGGATLSMPCVGNATATVVGENRTLSVASGSFTDSFADGNAVHIYRIDGGSRCGLS